LIHFSGTGVESHITSDVAIVFGFCSRGRRGEL
jgi:hypothetical protein